MLEDIFLAKLYYIQHENKRINKDLFKFLLARLGRYNLFEKKNTCKSKILCAQPKSLQWYLNICSPDCNSTHLMSKQITNILYNFTEKNIAFDLTTSLISTTMRE